MPFLRRHALFLVVLGLAAGLRLPALGWLPSPAGDEGNWTLYGLRILNGQPAALASNAAFVSLLYAHLIAAAMAALGPGFLAARLIGALAVLLAVAAAYAVPAWLGSRRAGLAAAVVVAVHPWAVFYSRIASVPYALAFTVELVGPLLLVAGLLRRRAWLVAAGVLVVSLGAHFSPLTAVAAGACAALVLAPAHRWVLRSPALYLAVLAAAAHAVPVIRSAAAVAREAPAIDATTGFAGKLWSYVHMMGTGLAGEATLRHFTNTAVRPELAALMIVPVIGLAAAALTRPARRASVTGGFGPLYLLVALLLSPLVLAPGREWDLPANHMDRYLFAVLPGFVLTVADVALLPRLGGWAVATLALWLGVGCTGRAAGQFLFAHGVDHGESVAEGGSGYRGWLVSDRPVATMLQIREAIEREALGREATLLVADRVFIPMEFALQGTLIEVFDVRRAGIPHPRRGPYFMAVWPDEVLSVRSPPTAPRKYVASNQALRARVNAFFREVRLVRRFVQRDGAPLFELWRADQPVRRLQTE